MKHAILSLLLVSLVQGGSKPKCPNKGNGEGNNTIIDNSKGNNTDIDYGKDKFVSLEQCLRSLSTRFIVQSSNDYDAAKFEWNSRVPDVKPAAIVLPTTKEQVSDAVKCATKSNTTIAIRSGGHSYEGYSLGGKDGSLVIDLRDMNQVKIDQQSKTALVDGGALLGQIYWAAWQNGKLALPAGTCPTVGIGGHATGGGFGRYSRTYGMVLDNLLEAEVVLANGKIVIANKEENSDLFWALRGSGTGSYGVVTKFKFQLFQTPSHIANFNFDFPVSLDNYTSVFKEIQSYSQRLPLNIGASLGLYSRSIGFSGAVLANSEQEKQALIQDMKTNLPPFKSSSVSDMSFIENVMAYSGLPGSDPSVLGSVKRWDTKKFFKAKGGFTNKSFPDDLLAQLGKKMSESPAGTFILLDVQGGKVNSVPVDDTAVSHRQGTIFDIQMIADAKDNVEGEKLMPWMNETHNLLYPHLSGAYINYLDKDEPNWEMNYYGNHYARLQTIKRKYDPTNAFSNPMSVKI